MHMQMYILTTILTFMSGEFLTSSDGGWRGYAGLRYTNVISNGGNKKFDHLVSLKIYVDNVFTEKQECVNQVAKLLGTEQRNLVKNCAQKKNNISYEGPAEAPLNNASHLTKTHAPRKMPGN